MVKALQARRDSEKSWREFFVISGDIDDARRAFAAVCVAYVRELLDTQHMNSTAGACTCAGLPGAACSKCPLPPTAKVRSYLQRMLDDELERISWTNQPGAGLRDIESQKASAYEFLCDLGPLITAALTRATAAEIDARRYQWLRTPPNNLHPSVYVAGSLLMREEYLDTAIDAALALRPSGDGVGHD